MNKDKVQTLSPTEFLKSDSIDDKQSTVGLSGPQIRNWSGPMSGQKPVLYRFKYGFSEYTSSLNPDIPGPNLVRFTH